MRALWSEQRKFEIWLEIETLSCEALAELGTIPREDARTIRETSRLLLELGFENISMDLILRLPGQTACQSTQRKQAA